MLACTYAGLGNRWQNIVHAILPSTRKACGLDDQSQGRVGWQRDKDVGATFLDLFEPHPELQMLETAEDIGIRECTLPCGVSATAKPSPRLCRSCGPCISSAEDAIRCDAFLAKVNIARDLRLLVEAILPASKQLIAVHLRAVDADLELPAIGRRLSQGTPACHHPQAFAAAVAEHIVSREQHHNHETIVYVATGSNTLIHEFTQLLSDELTQRSRENRKRRVVSAKDIFNLVSQRNVSWAINMSSHEARSSVVGIKLAAADLYAMSSARVLFRGLESTLALLAAAINRRPQEVLVHNTSVPGCDKLWRGYMPRDDARQWNATVAFCSPHRLRSQLEANGACQRSLHFCG